MNQQERKELKNKILLRHELFELNHSKIKRLQNDPIRTFVFYIMAALSYIKPYRVVKSTLWGKNMSYYLPEANAIYYYGFFEANLTNFFINFLKEGDTFLDVGAHVGYYSMLAAELVGSAGKVYSFEPTPRTFESLSINANEYDNVVVNNFAVLNEERTISFIDYGPRYSAFNGFKERTSVEVNFLKNQGSKIEVKTIILDEYCEKNNIKPTFIKIDAEGAEHLILKGMNKLLTNVRPLVSIEVAGEEEWQENCRKSIDILISYGYVALALTLEGKLEEHVVRDKYLYDNLIFIPKEKIETVMAFVNSI